MKTKLWPIFLAFGGLTAVCEASLAAPSNTSVSIPLIATTYNAGRIGQATLVQTGNSTEIILTVSNIPSEVALSPHLYAYVYSGKCGNVGANPVYALNQRVKLESYNPMQMFKSVPISLQALRSSDYAIVIRTSTADGYRDIFCGNLHQVT
ncbi:hypothetical protein BH160DRAFT_2844 [Burkholderia sp. H160]|nr:hypothetical protein BH160DRAFT_2844 [Burkholderia sp. H160]